MDTHKLEVAPKVGQLNLIQDDEIVARVHESDRRGYEEAQDYAEQIARRWNAFDRLMDALADMKQTAAQVQHMMDGDKEKQEAWTEELGRLYVAIDAADALMNELNP